MRFYTYIIESLKCPGKRYVGHSSNLKQRVFEHNTCRCVYTAKFAPWKLKIYVAFETLEQAQHFEHYLKSGSGHAFAGRHFWLDTAAARQGRRLRAESCTGSRRASVPLLAASFPDKSELTSPTRRGSVVDHDIKRLAGRPFCQTNVRPGRLAPMMRWQMKTVLREHIEAKIINLLFDTRVPNHVSQIAVRIQESREDTLQAIQRLVKNRTIKSAQDFTLLDSTGEILAYTLADTSSPPTPFPPSAPPPRLTPQAPRG